MFEKVWFLNIYYQGHHYPDHGDEPENLALPLETFTVKYGSSYRFRVINAGMIYAFRVSVDEVSYIKQNIVIVSPIHLIYKILLVLSILKPK